MLQFTISSTTLAGALNDLSRVINRKASMPILTNVHISMDNAGRLTMTGADGNDFTMTKTIQADRWEGAGVFIADIDQMTNALKGMPEQDITLRVNANRCEIDYKGSSLSFLTGEANKYPTLANNELENAVTAYIDGQTLVEGVAHCRYACANDPIRIVMTGVFMEYANGTITFASTDGRKLTAVDRKADLQTDAFSGILNQKTCDIIRATVNAGKQVRMIINNEYVSLQYGNTLFLARLVEGRYPNFRGVIPTNIDYRIVVSKASLAASVKRLATFAPSGSGLIRLDYKAEDGTLVLTAKDIDLFARTMTESMAIVSATATDGGPIPDMAIGLSATYMLQVLQNFGSENITLCFIAKGDTNDTERPVKFEGDMAQTLLMPMMLNDEPVAEEEPQDEDDDEPLPDDGPDDEAVGEIAA